METVIRKKNILHVLVTLLVFTWSGSVMAQEGLYSLTDLGNLGGPRIYNVDINDVGKIVGCGETEIITDGRIWKAFVEDQSKIKPLFNDGNIRSSANSINRGGVIAGHKDGKAFLIGNTGVFTDLGSVLDDPVNWGISVNAASKVVGYSIGSYDRGVLWENSSPNVYGVTDIGNLGGFTTQALGINDADQIVGFSINSKGSSQAFLWQRIGGNSSMTPLGVLPGFSDSTATRINNKGEVIGYSWKSDSGITNACIWRSDSLATPINLQNFSTLENITNSQAFGINDKSVVVGVFILDGQERAFIWDGVNGMRDLNSLIPAGSGMTLSVAYAINNKGQIVGYGQKTGSGNASVFLLTPPAVDEPSMPYGVDIDIRPWNLHNHVNTHARWGLIPVAILSNKNLQAPRDVVKKSLRFGQTGNENSLAFCGHWHWDVNHDGQKDLICYFHEGPSKFQCGDKEGILRGETKDGVEFEGRDMVQVVPCKPFKNHR
jgi:probable HAF family extracellular repeat protein